jgi:hypothetical protein
LRLPCGPPLQLVGLCHVRDDVLHMLLGILLGQAGATPNQLRQISPITRTQIPVGYGPIFGLPLRDGLYTTLFRSAQDRSRSESAG